jgi:tight adherence protein C
MNVNATPPSPATPKRWAALIIVGFGLSGAAPFLWPELWAMSNRLGAATGQAWSGLTAPVADGLGVVGEVLGPVLQRNAAAGLAAVCGGLAVALLASALRSLVDRRAARARLSAFALQLSRAATAPAAERLPLLVLLGSAVVRCLPPRWRTALRLQAARAGLQEAHAAERVLGIRLVCAPVSLLLAAGFQSAPDETGLAGLAAFLVAAIGLSGTDLLLISRAGARRRAAERDLPTVLDLLTLSMAAGMGFDLAIEAILQRLQGPLAEELQRYLRELNDLGSSREDALRGVARRLSNAPDLIAFGEAVVHAHVLGTGLLAAVESQATLLRRERRRQAAASAQRAPVRMLIPMTLFMLPVLMLIVLAPIGLRLINAR